MAERWEGGEAAGGPLVGGARRFLVGRRKLLWRLWLCVVFPETNVGLT